MSSLLPVYGDGRLELVGGSGAILRDAQGRSYIDLVAGIAVASLGHGHAELAAAIAAQAAELVHVSNLYATRPQAVLADRLAVLTGGMRSFFCNSGAEAVEAALKIARKHGNRSGRPLIVCARGAFHGRTLGALSATGQPAKQEPFRPLLPGFVHVAYGDADAVARVLGSGDVAAVLLEPVQGEAGVIVPPPGYLAAVRAACDDAGALLIVDEVQTGVGRTGRWWGWQHEEAMPDVMCVAKGLGGGLPIGACLARGEAAEVLEPGDHASTFGGGPVQCTAALTVLDVIERDGLVQRSAELGRVALEHLRERLPGAEVRGRGLLIGIELDGPRAGAVAAAAQRRGVLVNPATAAVLRVAPPLVIVEDELVAGLDAVVEACGEVAAA